MRRSSFSVGKARLLGTIVCAILAIALGLAMFSQPYGAKAKSDSVPYEGYAYELDSSSREDSMVKANEFNVKLAQEGFTLLQNAGGLPLASTVKKVNLFGKNWSNPAYGGSGSSSFSTSSGNGIDGYTAIKNGGYEFNPDLKKFYDDTAKSGPIRPAYQYTVTTTMKTAETPVAKYDATLQKTFANYADASIIMLSRTGGEGCDTSAFLTEGTEGRKNLEGAHYLQLDDNEKDLIDLAKKSVKTGGKVILLINAAQPLEFTDADLAKLDAVLWIGLPGSTGFNALGSILKGTVSPSGRTVDTYAKSFAKDPTYQNFAINGQPVVRENPDDSSSTIIKQAGNALLLADGASAGATEVTYEEGIYLGYKYWETRAVEEDKKTGTTANKWWTENVRYPFGYGLSYTSFEYTAASISATDFNKDGTITASVTIKNKGSVAGKEVVQFYYSAPYTSGKIEKAHVELGDFAKTKVLNPGESQTITLSIPVKNMASYDWDDANTNKFKGYELDAGDYNFFIGTNAHCWYGAKTSVTAGTTTAVTAKATLAAGIKYEMNVDNKTYAADEVHSDNRFDDVSKGLKGDGIKEMSRSDFEGTFPTRPTVEERTVSAELATAIKKYGVYTKEDPDGSDYDKDQAWFVAENKMPTQRATALTGEETDIARLIDLKDKAYDDPLWETFLNQFTITQLVDFVENGKFKSEVFPALGIPEGIHPDGPFGFVGQINGYGSARCYYVSPCIVAATFNKELVKEQGEHIGEEGAWMGYNAIYGPGVNIHRSPFSGRNFEYYSEDAFLTGTIAAYVTEGMQSKGVFPFLKHFALNDQETDRGGITTWATEQASREIYLRAFQIAVEKSDAMGIMSSFNRIGKTWAGASYPLLTDVLRKEWGFKGIVVTDWYNGGYMDQDQMVRAGNDLSLGTAKNITKTINTYGANNVLTATMVTALRNAAHNMSYATLKSCNMSKLVNYDDHLVLAKTYTLSKGEKLVLDFGSETYEAAYAGLKYVKTRSDSLTSHATNPAKLAQDLPEKYVTLNETTGEVTVEFPVTEEVAQSYQLNISIQLSNGKYIGQSMAVFIDYTGKTVDQSIADITAKTAELQAKIDLLETALKTANEAIAKLQTSSDASDAQIAALKTASEALQTTLDSANSAIAELKAAQGASDAELKTALENADKAIVAINTKLSADNELLKSDLASANKVLGVAVGLCVAGLCVSVLGMAACIVLLVLKKKKV